MILCDEFVIQSRVVKSNDLCGEFVIQSRVVKSNDLCGEFCYSGVE